MMTGVALAPEEIDTVTRVLLVEDDPLISGGMARRLRHQGWDVDAVSDGVTALELARAGAHDIMVLDVGLPGMDGLSVLGAMHGDPAAPAVILMSAYLDVSRTLFALERGAMEVLEKPVEPQRLIDAVRDVDLRRRTQRGERSSHQKANDELIPEFVGGSPRARLLREQVVTAARFPDLPVMVIGETGTGKELVAQAVHRLSRGGGRMVSLNCAAQPAELFESEVFGHEAGSFTGARSARTGLFEMAAAGTVFLDEVGEMPATQQAKLLRAVETRSFRRVGSNREQPLQARIVSATNRPLRGREEDRLRSDLFFRLAGYTIRTPPLRERMEDIESLARHFLADFAVTYPSMPTALSPRAAEALHAHDWPGNVRELRSIVHFAAVRATHGVVGVQHVAEAFRARGCLDDLSSSAASSPSSEPLPTPRDQLASTPPMTNLPELERELIMRTYGESGGNVSVAARKLGIARTTLRDKLVRYGVR